MLERDEKQWDLWNRLGLIPGPLESEALFLERVDFCLSLQEKISQEPLLFPDGCACKEDKSLYLEEAFPVTRALYGIEPSWTPLFFSNDGLFFWQGGCAVIFQLSQEAPVAAFIQLSRSFKKSATLLGIYSRKELLAHELCHIARMAFPESRFEEFFAYQSSPSLLRRLLGPIIASSLESTLFLSSLLFSFFSDLGAFFSPFDAFFYSLAWLFKLLAVALAFLGIVRLFWAQLQLKRCQKKLAVFLRQEKARQLLFRLSDREIQLFGQLPLEEVGKSLREGADSSFRWQFLKRVYGADCLYSSNAFFEASS